MQFHLNGYVVGDPRVAEAASDDQGDGLPPEVDVLIVGCGPAGLVLAAQLANFPEIRTAIVDRRGGPLEIGQADGVACRTVEMFQAFGLARELVDEAYWVNEVTFWRADPSGLGHIVRQGRIDDTEEGLSEFPHVIVNQARMLAHLREYMERSPSRLRPTYGLQATDVVHDPEFDSVHPVRVSFRHTNGAAELEQTTVRARYVVGCDGARSTIRDGIGQVLVGDVTNERWGVMDVLAVTDFPDIRLKAAISTERGNVLIIPREGGYLVRFYIELDETIGPKNVTVDDLTEVANRVMHPYSVEVKDVAWWSVYEIGQRLCERFDNVRAEAGGERPPSVFIAGDACHTHSAKAGQGMNVSMADAWNLGWKLAAVLRGHARSELLHTYSLERRQTAAELIDFDREFSRRFRSGADDAAVDPEEFQRYFVAQGRFTAGVATRYAPSMITGEAVFQDLAKGFPVGMRFHSARVVRLADGKPIQIGHVALADGAWRIYVFGDRSDPTRAGSPMNELFEFLGSKRSPLHRYTPAGVEPDAVIDLRAIFQQHHRDVALGDLPTSLLPRKGRFGLIDYEKVFCPDPKAEDIFDLRDIDRGRGCMVVVRPDQYVSHVLPLNGYEQLNEHFERVLIRQD